MSRGDASAVPTFVGRVQELCELQEELARAGAGDPRVVLVSGPAGSGKSALIERLLARARAQGAGSVVVAADGQEGHLRFGVLSRLLAALEGDRPPPRPSALEDPVEAGVRMLDRLGHLVGAPMVLVVEDAQCADRASLDALAFVLRRLHVEPVLCLIAFRDEPAALPEGLLRSVEARRGRSIRVPPLSVDDVVELAAAAGLPRLTRAAATRLREATAGSPLHVRALLDELDVDELTSTWGMLPAPRSFRAVLLPRLAACSTDAERLVAAAAVCGQRTSFALVAEVAGLAAPIPAVDEAVGAGFLRLCEGADGQVLEFEQPLVRSAVYHGLGPERRAGLHARAAERSVGASALRHRVAAAPPCDPELSAELVDHAMASVEVGALDAAGEHLLAALRLAPPGRDRGQLLVRTIDVLLRGGRCPDALALRGELLSLPPGQRRSYLLGSMALLVGEHGEAADELVRAWEGVGGERDDELSALAAIQLGDLRLIQARPTDAVGWARRALAGPLASAADGAARRILFLGLGMSGQIGETTELDDLAGVTADRTDQTAFEPLLARGIVRLWIDDLAGAEHDLAVVASAAGERCPLRVRLGGTACLAKTRYYLGDWDAAVADAAVGVSLAEDAEHWWALAFLHAAAALVPAARGDWAIARHHAQQAERAARATGHATDRAYAVHAHAHVAFCQDDHAAVIAAVEPVLEFVEAGGIEEPGAMPWYELYAQALVSSQRYEDAHAIVNRIDRLPAVRRRALATAHLAGIRGRLAAAEGDTAAAVRSFAEATSLLDGHPAVFDRALLQDNYGRVLRRMGRRRRAAEHLGAAVEVYRTLAADPFLDRCERELAACGLHPTRRGGAAQQRLTPQEEVVSRLVARGMTNRQVAAELVVSVKTVEYHLSNVYRKLGMSSRTQLVAHLAAGPAADPEVPSTSADPAG